MKYFTYCYRFCVVGSPYSFHRKDRGQAFSVLADDYFSAFCKLVDYLGRTEVTDFSVHFLFREYLNPLVGSPSAGRRSDYTNVSIFIE